MMRLQWAAVATLPVLAISAIAENAAGSTQDASTAQCRDDDSFLDAGGYPCHAWRRFDCSFSWDYGGFHYGGAAMKEIRQHCPASCGLCLDKRFHRRDGIGLPLPSSLLTEGLHLSKATRPTEAITKFMKVVAIAPASRESATAQFHISWALAAFVDAASQGAVVPRAWIQMSSASNLLHVVAASATLLPSTSPMPYERMASLLEKMGRREEAIRYYWDGLRRRDRMGAGNGRSPTRERRAQLEHEAVAWKTDPFLACDLVECRDNDRPGFLAHHSTVAERLVALLRDPSEGRIDEATAVHVRHVAQPQHYYAWIDGQPPKHVARLHRLKEVEGFRPKVIYDIGAAVSGWAKEAAKVWPEAAIYLFEAFDHLEYMYQTPALRNNYHIGLLGDTDGKMVKYYYNDKFVCGNSMYLEVGTSGVYDPARYQRLRMQRLDTVVASRGWPPPDLIKIDVQGAEHDVLAGAPDSLRSSKYVIVELQHKEYNRGALKAPESILRIEALGWQVVPPKPGSPEAAAAAAVAACHAEAAEAVVLAFDSECGRPDADYLFRYKDKA